MEEKIAPAAEISAPKLKRISATQSSKSNMALPVINVDYKKSSHYHFSVVSVPLPRLQCNFPLLESRVRSTVCVHPADDVSHDETNCAVTQVLAELLLSTKQEVCFSQQEAPQLKSLLREQQS